MDNIDYKTNNARKNRNKHKKNKNDNRNIVSCNILEKDRIKCILCNENNNEISMTCAGMHSYCFSCIRQWMISKKVLTCPECRKQCDDFIKIPILKDKHSKEFKEFLESAKIIPNPMKHDDDCKCFQTFFENTCIYPYWTLINFIENKNQLELYHENIKNEKYKDNIDALSKLIKWFVISEDDDKYTHHRHSHRINT
jgi:hypothetical protein